MQLPPKPPARAGSQERSAKARLEAEAFFRPSAPTPEISATVVTLKKRRALPSSEQAEPLELQSEQVRAPRVHRVVSNERSAEPSGLPGEAAQESTEAAAAEPAGQAATVRRRRRLHGRVSILRPMAVEAPEEAAAEPGLAPVSEHPAAIEGGADAFIFVRAPSQRHVDLLARIAELQAEAEKLRKQEVAHAIEWMRVAIRDYGLTKQDLGFQ